MATQILDSSTAESPAHEANKKLPSALVERMAAHASEGLILLARDGSLLYVNEAAGKAFERSRDELVGLRFWELTENVEAADWLDHWDEIRRRGQCTMACDCRGDDASESAPVHVEASMRHFEFEDEEYISLVVRLVVARSRADRARGAEDQPRVPRSDVRPARLPRRGGKQVLDQEAHSGVRARMDLASDLGNAIAREQLIVHYQPIVDLESRQIHGFEALIRWIHPRRGLIPPLDFIPLAEELDLVVPIDRFVLKEACRQYRQWTDELGARAALPVSVNFSGRQFADPGLVRDVERILDETGFDPRRLVIEITESAVMKHPEVASVLFDDLKALGVMLAIDDFGTGYSSLSYLHSLPVDALKIDRSFVGRMSTTDRKHEIVKAIITMSHNLDLRVVAEGIETEQQRSILRELGCELGQGALFTLPVDAQRARELISDAKSL